MNPTEFASHRRTLATTAGEVSVVDVGEVGAPVALFVHGVFMNAYLWHNAIDGGRDVRRCVAVDLPGHGATPLADHDLSLDGHGAMLAAVCDALDVAQVDLVANDSGGALAQAFAARHPDRIRTLTLTNCDVHTNLPPEAFAPIVALAEAGQLAEVIAPVFADPDAARAPTAFGSGFEHPDQVSDEDLHAFIDPILGRPDAASDIERFIVALKVEDLVALEPLLKALEAPTLIVWGTGDPFFGPEWAQWLRDTIPGTTEVVEVADAKLFFPHERPEDLVPHLRRHWTEHAPA
jgi:pimeloyl-ACP methyl ester carboxylesterase